MLPLGGVTWVKWNCFSYPFECIYSWIFFFLECGAGISPLGSWFPIKIFPSKDGCQNLMFSVEDMRAVISYTAILLMSPTQCLIRFISPFLSRKPIEDTMRPEVGKTSKYTGSFGDPSSWGKQRWKGCVARRWENCLMRTISWRTSAL